MPSGTIYLYRQTGELIELKKYFTIGQRRDIIAKWKHIYNPEGYYQIDPRSPYTRIVQKKIIPDVPKEKLIRPQAIYTNLPSPMSIATEFINNHIPEDET